MGGVVAKIIRIVIDDIALKNDIRCIFHPKMTVKAPDKRIAGYTDSLHIFHLDGRLLIADVIPRDAKQPDLQSILGMPVEMYVGTTITSFRLDIVPGNRPLPDTAALPRIKKYTSSEKI